MVTETFVNTWHYKTLQLRYNERGSVSNQQHLRCLLECRFRRRSKKTSKLRVTGLCMGNSPVTGEFPAPKASNEENVSIWWLVGLSGVSCRESVLDRVNWKGGFVTQFIIIIKSKVFNFRFVVIFFRGCVTEGNVKSYFVISWETRKHWHVVSIIKVQSMVCANDRAHYTLRVVFVCLHITLSHYHHYANLSDAIDLNF